MRRILLKMCGIQKHDLPLLKCHHSVYAEGWVTGELWFDSQQRRDFFSLIPHPDQLCSLPRLLSYSYWDCPPWKMSGVQTW
jgi:hypothetical protein